jgi:hypothetical protein
MSPDGITTDPKKLEAVWEWLTPRSKQKIRIFLGLCNYYRQFVSSFADIAKLLTRLKRKK